MLGVSVTDRLAPFTLPLSIPPLMLLELVETHVPESEAPDCEIVARMFADAPRLSLVVPTHVPSTTLADVEPGPTGRPQDNAEIRSRTTQPRLNIGIVCSPYVRSRLTILVVTAVQMFGDATPIEVVAATRACPGLW
jgi:hypothetical protein